MAKILVRFNESASRVDAASTLTQRMMSFYNDEGNLLFIAEDNSLYDFLSKQYLQDETNNAALLIGLQWSGSATNVQAALEELRTAVNNNTIQTFNWRGAWSSGSNYAPYDLVEYNGSTYICTSTITGGTTAPDASADWDVFVEGGTGGGGCPTTAHVSTETGLSSALSDDTIDNIHLCNDIEITGGGNWSVNMAATDEYKVIQYSGDNTLILSAAVNIASGNCKGLQILANVAAGADVTVTYAPRLMLRTVESGGAFTLNFAGSTYSALYEKLVQDLGLPYVLDGAVTGTAIKLYWDNTNIEEGLPDNYATVTTEPELRAALSNTAIDVILLGDDIGLFGASYTVASTSARKVVLDTGFSLFGAQSTVQFSASTDFQILCPYVITVALANVHTIEMLAGGLSMRRLATTNASNSFDLIGSIRYEDVVVALGGQPLADGDVTGGVQSFWNNTNRSTGGGGSLEEWVKTTETPIDFVLIENKTWEFQTSSVPEIYEGESGLYEIKIVDNDTTQYCTGIINLSTYNGFKQSSVLSWSSETSVLGYGVQGFTVHISDAGASIYSFGVKYDGDINNVDVFIRRISLSGKDFNGGQLRVVANQDSALPLGSVPSENFFFVSNEVELQTALSSSEFFPIYIQSPITLTQNLTASVQTAKEVYGYPINLGTRQMTLNGEIVKFISDIDLSTGSISGNSSPHFRRVNATPFSQYNGSGTLTYEELYGVSSLNGTGTTVKNYWYSLGYIGVFVSITEDESITGRKWFGLNVDEFGPDDISQIVVDGITTTRTAYPNPFTGQGWSFNSAPNNPVGEPPNSMIHKNSASNINLQVFVGKWHNIITDDGESTIALQRSDADEVNVEVMDIYNNGYNSNVGVHPEALQYGIRMQKRGTGRWNPFVIDYRDLLTTDVEEFYRANPDDMYNEMAKPLKIDAPGFGPSEVWYRGAPFAFMRPSDQNSNFFLFRDEDTSSRALVGYQDPSKFDLIVYNDRLEIFSGAALEFGSSDKIRITAGVALDNVNTELGLGVKSDGSLCYFEPFINSVSGHSVLARSTGSTGTIDQIALGTNQVLGRLTGDVTAIDISALSTSASWGSITGTLSDQTDLQNALNGKLSLTAGSTEILTGGLFQDLANLSDIAFASSLTADTNQRVVLKGDRLEFGDGTNARDVILSRSGAGILDIDNLVNINYTTTGRGLTITGQGNAATGDAQLKLVSTSAGANAVVGTSLWDSADNLIGFCGHGSSTQPHMYLYNYITDGDIRLGALGGGTGKVQVESPFQVFNKDVTFTGGGLNRFFLNSATGEVIIGTDPAQDQILQVNGTSWFGGNITSASGTILTMPTTAVPANGIINLITNSNSTGQYTPLVLQNTNGTGANRVGIKWLAANGSAVGEFYTNVNDASTANPYDFVLRNRQNGGKVEFTVASTGGTSNFDALSISFDEVYTDTPTFSARGARVSMPNLPTSSAGLAAGDLWNDGGTLKIA